MTSVWNVVNEGMQYLVSSCLLVLQLPLSALSINKWTDIVDFNTWAEEHFARENTLEVEQWEQGLPSQEEEDQMKQLLTKLYSLEDVTKTDTNDLMKDYPLLWNIITLTVINDTIVVHEKPLSDNNLFPRYWGYVAIRGKNFAQRNIHHSAAHYESDGEVCKQSAVLFDTTSSRSLVVAGASRYAVKGNATSPCQPTNKMADAAHNCQTMFHKWNIMLCDLANQDMNNNNVLDGHFFMQWHGMAETSCLDTDVFISAGIGNSSVYDMSIPATMIHTTFNRHSSTTHLNCSSPREDPSCRLTASSNVFGRYINGVAKQDVCQQKAQIEDIHGRFVHVEQKHAARHSLELWTLVLNETFPVKNDVSSYVTCYLFTISLTLSTHLVLQRLVAA